MYTRMDVLFVKQGEYEKGDAAFPLIKECASFFDALRDGLDPTGRYSSSNGADLNVLRTEKGKPYLDLGSDMTKPVTDISVSHSGDIWMCLFSDGPCGVDVQYVKDLKSTSIADRFFTAGESRYVKEGGDFFDVWCRREALGKCVGDGWFGDYPDVCPGGVLAESVSVEESVLYFHDISKELAGIEGLSIEKDLKAVCLTGSVEAPSVRLI